MACLLSVEQIIMTNITLKKPIKRGETEITQFDIREPSAGELRGIRLSDLLNGDVEALMVILPRITNPILQKNEVSALGAQDIATVAGEVMDFFMPAG
jgi:hypothetical protein